MAGEIAAQKDGLGAVDHPRPEPALHGPAPGADKADDDIGGVDLAGQAVGVDRCAEIADRDIGRGGPSRGEGHEIQRMPAKRALLRLAAVAVELVETARSARRMEQKNARPTAHGAITARISRAAQAQRGP